MQFEISQKRNIFRASLRREFIDSFQRTIRNKYLERENEESNKRIRLEEKNTMESLEVILEEILKLSPEQICTTDNFETLIECVNTVANRKQSAGSEINYSHIQRCDSVFQQKNSEYLFNGPSSNFFFSNHNLQGGNRVSGTWAHKEKMYSLISRILDKACNEVNGRIWNVLDKFLYLLEFPELMSIWEKLSNINHEKSKNFCASEFAQKLTKSTNVLGEDTRNISCILDQDFVLDILTNFIVENPPVSFEIVLQLMPFLSYSLNIYTSKDMNSREETYPKLNKASIIIRSVLKEEGKYRLNELIENSYEDILVYLLTETCFLLDAKKEKNARENLMVDEEFGKMSEYNINSSFKKRLECGYLSSKNRSENFETNRKPINLLITTKINLVKLLNRFFVTNQDAAIFLSSKIQGTNIWISLLSPFFTSTTDACLLNESPTKKDSESMTFKYSYIILCDSHKIILKTILNTIVTIMVAGTSSGHSFVRDFMENDGIKFMEICLTLDDLYEHNCREIANIFGVLDSEGFGFYDQLSSEQFKKFIQIEAELITLWSEHHFESSQVYLSSPNTLDIRYSLPKILKTTRNSLLSAYARATDPSIFEECSDLVLYSSSIQEMLKNNFKKVNNEEGQMEILCEQIYELCNNPVNYLKRNEKNGGV